MGYDKENVMDKELIDVKMDKNFLSVVSLSDQSDDRDFWFAMDPIERLRHIEVLRRINYGHGATSGLQRILEYVDDIRIYMISRTYLEKSGINQNAGCLV